jgi:hypothetical protein
MPTRAATTRAVRSALLRVPHFNPTILSAPTPLKNAGPFHAAALTLPVRGLDVAR